MIQIVGSFYLFDYQNLRKITMVYSLWKQMNIYQTIKEAVLTIQSSEIHSGHLWKETKLKSE